VGLGVTVIMLHESCMGDFEDLLGVIVVSGVIMFLEDAATVDMTIICTWSYIADHHVKESPKNYLKSLK